MTPVGAARAQHASPPRRRSAQRAWCEAWVEAWAARCAMCVRELCGEVVKCSSVDSQRAVTAASVCDRARVSRVETRGSESTHMGAAEILFLLPSLVWIPNIAVAGLGASDCSVLHSRLQYVMRGR